MKPTLLIIAAALVLSACDNSSSSSSTSSSSETTQTLSLPNNGETVTISGKMTFWMYEGDGGCFGSLESEGQEIELWVDADMCGDKDFEENAPATVSITYRTENQYGSDKIYTIVGFN